MKNGDMIMLLVLALFLAGIWALSKKCPANPVRNTESPLPINQYTSGAVSNGMDVGTRVNFQQQPYGGPTTG